MYKSFSDAKTAKLF